jgi:hypothetical protein
MTERGARKIFELLEERRVCPGHVCKEMVKRCVLDAHVSNPSKCTLSSGKKMSVAERRRALFIAQPWCNFWQRDTFRANV